MGACVLGCKFSHKLRNNGLAGQLKSADVLSILIRMLPLLSTVVVLEGANVFCVLSHER